MKKEADTETKNLLTSGDFKCLCVILSNQIRVVAFGVPQLTQASFLQKNQMSQKVDYFILPLFLVPKLRSVAQNEWKKHPYIFFLLLVQK